MAHTGEISVACKLNFGTVDLSATAARCLVEKSQNMQLLGLLLVLY